MIREARSEISLAGGYRALVARGVHADREEDVVRVVVRAASASRRLGASAPMSVTL
jgi:hypothetical protein